MPDERGPGDYDWLFDPSAPVAPESSAAAPPRPPALHSTPPKLPPPNLPKPKRAGGLLRAKGTWGIVGVAVPVVWIVYLIAVPALAWASVATTEAFPGGTRPAEQDGSTFLVVGSDSRKGLSAEQRKDLRTGEDTGGRGRTDTIMLLHVGRGKPVLISIPRDSLLPIPGYGTTKVNAAYAFGGPQLLVETLEAATGVRVDHYVEIGFGGVVNLVDAVGGVEICPKQDLDDKDAGLNVKKGCQDADGETALAYSRARHAFANGDLQRVQSQREVIGGIGSKIKSPMTFLDPIRYYRVVNGGASSVTIDDTAGIPDMARFGLALASAMGDRGVNCTVPISDMAVHWDSDRALQLFQRIQASDTETLDDSPLCTKDGLPPGVG
jgi:LCP family protein required for cell wall assembly